MSNLSERFSKLAAKYSEDAEFIGQLWKEINDFHSDPHRHYHNLAHLENMLGQLDATREQITDFDVVEFALFYHDIIYDPTNTANEEDSARLARMRLAELQVPEQRIEKVIKLILATKSHLSTGDNDTDYFTDADLSILGTSPEQYDRYAENVRMEFSMVPDPVFYRGRERVLNHFLESPNIFKTRHHQHKHEAQARQNLSREIARIKNL